MFFFLIQMISWLDWQLEELIFKNQTSVPDRIEPFPEASDEIPRKKICLKIRNMKNNF